MKFSAWLVRLVIVGSLGISILLLAVPDCLAQGVVYNGPPVQQGDMEDFEITWKDGGPSGAILGLTRVKKNLGENFVTLTFSKVGPGMPATVSAMELATLSVTKSCAPCPPDDAVDLVFGIKVYGREMPEGSSAANLKLPVQTRAMVFVHGQAMVKVAGSGKKAGTYSQVILNAATNIDDDGQLRVFVPDKPLPIFDIRDPYPGQVLLRPQPGSKPLATVALDIPQLRNIALSPPPHVIANKPVELNEGDKVRRLLDFETFWRVDCNCDGIDETFIFRVNWRPFVAVNDIGLLGESGGFAQLLTGVGITGPDPDNSSFVGAATNPTIAQPGGGWSGFPNDWVEQ